jgi:hypothetical protein
LRELFVENIAVHKTFYGNVVPFVVFGGHDEISKDFQGLNSMAKGSSVCTSDLLAYGNFS